MTTVCKVMRYETCIKKSCNSKILQKSPQPWLWPKLVNFFFAQLNLSSCALFKACFLDIPLTFPGLIGSPFPLNSSSADPHLTLVHPAQNHPKSHGLSSCPGCQLFSWFHHGFTVDPQIKYDDSISDIISTSFHGWSMLIMSNLIPSPLGPSPSSKHQLQQDVSWPMMEQSWGRFDLQNLQHRGHSFCGWIAVFVGNKTLPLLNTAWPDLKSLLSGKQTQKKHT